MSKKCITHHACDCIMARIEKIEEVYQRYKHLDKFLSDDRWNHDDALTRCRYDLWKAIRREED